MHPIERCGEDYLRMAEAAAISPELLHRVAVMAAVGMDTPPHCGVISGARGFLHAAAKVLRL